MHDPKYWTVEDGRGGGEEGRKKLAENRKANELNYNGTRV